MNTSLASLDKKHSFSPAAEMFVTVKKKKKQDVKGKH